MSHSPTGKISRLPHQIREEIHSRLRNGNRNKQILRLPQRHPRSSTTGRRRICRPFSFPGQPLPMEETPHPAWLLQQAALSQASRFLSQSRQLAQAGDGTVTDRIWPPLLPPNTPWPPFNPKTSAIRPPPGKSCAPSATTSSLCAGATTRRMLAPPASAPAIAPGQKTRHNQTMNYPPWRDPSGPVTKCSAGVLACGFWRRPAARVAALGRDAR